MGKCTTPTNGPFSPSNKNIRDKPSLGNRIETRPLIDEEAKIQKKLWGSWERKTKISTQ